MTRGFEGTPPVDTPQSAITPGRATLAGTPLYLAPEVLDGAAQTARSDIYALGVLLFHALTGIFPVTGRTLREVHDRHREGQRKSLSEVRPDLPQALVSIVDRALDPDRAARFQTADEMAVSLGVGSRGPASRRRDVGRRRRDRSRHVERGGSVACRRGAVPVFGTGATQGTRPGAGRLVREHVGRHAFRPIGGTRGHGGGDGDSGLCCCVARSREQGARVHATRARLRPRRRIRARSGAEGWRHPCGDRRVDRRSRGSASHRSAHRRPPVRSERRHDQGGISGRRDGAHARCLASWHRWRARCAPRRLAGPHCRVRARDDGLVRGVAHLHRRAGRVREGTTIPSPRRTVPASHEARP